MKSMNQKEEAPKAEATQLSLVTNLPPLRGPLNDTPLLPKEQDREEEAGQHHESFPDTLTNFFWELLGYEREEQQERFRQQNPEEYEEEEDILVSPASFFVSSANEIFHAVSEFFPDLSTTFDVSINNNIEETIPQEDIIPEKEVIKAPLFIGYQKEDQESLIMTPELSIKIIPYLPPLLQLSASWSLLYNTQIHGISLKTLYSNCQNQDQGVLLLVESGQRRVFGGYATDFGTRNGFFGNGDCFLWRLNNDNEVDVYKATGKNQYMVLCEHHMIAFGSGDGKFGFYLHEDLVHGHSEKCDTYNNEVLNGSEHGSEFELLRVEVWGFVM